MHQRRWSRIPIAFALVLFWPALALAQEAAEAITQDDCALISEGVARLACYDSFSDPETARDAASKQQLEGPLTLRTSWRPTRKANHKPPKTAKTRKTM